MNSIKQNTDKRQHLMDIENLLIEVNKIQLYKKPHIKKYIKLRNLHSDIVDNMEEYMAKKNYNAPEYYSKVASEISKETGGLFLQLDSDNDDDMSILDELFIYKNYRKIPALTDIYIEKNKLRNKEKRKMLDSMKNSYASLFKIVAADRENGYVTYEDVFTHKKYRITDISTSSTFKKDNNRTAYIYNRLIQYEDITFTTGIHCVMSSDNKYLRSFLKEHNYKKCSDFSRCLMLYDISKKEEKLFLNCKSQYGYRR